MCSKCAAANHAATDAFSTRFLDMLNGASMMLMTSLGHRTGLFDRMAALPPSTSLEIARHAGLNERYVREWLGAMVTGGFVEYDANAEQYWLPSAHAAVLTRAGAPNNMAVSAQWIALLGAVEGEVAAAFEHGRGVPYAAYGPRFHEVMAEESAQTVLAALDESILPLVPGLKAKLLAGIEVLDVGCGKGLALIDLAERYPLSWFTGVDFSEEAIEAGRAEAARRGVKNVDLRVGDVAEYGSRNGAGAGGGGGGGGFDLVFAFDAIHDQARPAEVLANIRRLLNRGGTFLMQDIKARTAVQDNIGGPLGPFTYTVSCMHCMSVSLASGGPGLGAAWGREKALRMLAEAGFKDVRVEELSHDIINYYYIMHKAADDRLESMAA